VQCPKVKAYLGLGSNEGCSEKLLLSAIESLHKHPFISVSASASLYKSKPVDNTRQANFLNTAVAIVTTLDPYELLKECKNLEHKNQRKHHYHWGPRTLDIDILLYGNISIRNEVLTIPHKEIKNRDFVLAPLVELAPLLTLPTGKPINALLDTAPVNILSRQRVKNLYACDT
tara:strand:- start:7 stop:525 length:519 start_codon:yes stop_codon:yes gene_type:complete